MINVSETFRNVAKDSETFGIIRVTLLFYTRFVVRNTILRIKITLIDITGPKQYVKIK